MNRHKTFWNKEYKTGEHLALSPHPSEDLEKFTRFLQRQEGLYTLNPKNLVVDVGCGNGRNLVYLAENFGMRGIGYDISKEAIAQAQERSLELPITYEARSIEGVLGTEDESASLVLDMMSSHFLKKAAREELKNEIIRILKPGGWFFFKSFLGEEDLNAQRMLREHPADEENAYIHPRMGVYEYVWHTEEDIRVFFESHFEIFKVEKSHRHRDRQGKANKRRTVSVYMQRNG